MARRGRATTRRRRWRALGPSIGGAGLLLVAMLGMACSREPERSAPAFCTQVAAVKGFDEVLASGDANAIHQQLEGLRQLHQVAPSEIEPQVGLLVGIAEDLSRTMDTAKDPEAANRQVFARHQQNLPAITAAGNDVERYSADTCQILLNRTAEGGSTTSTSGGTSSSLPATTRPTSAR